MVDLARIRIKHLGGVFPSDHPLAGDAFGKVNISDIRRKSAGGIIRGGDIIFDPGEEKLLDDTAELRRSIKIGQLSKLISRGLFEVEDRIVQYIKSNDNQIQFIGEPFAPGSGVTTQLIEIAVTNAIANINIFSDVDEVTVDVDANLSGTIFLQTEDGAVVGSVGSSIVVPIVDGTAKIIATITAGAPATDTLGLTDSGGTGLIVTDTADIVWT